MANGYTYKIKVLTRFETVYQIYTDEGPERAGEMARNRVANTLHVEDMAGGPSVEVQSIERLKK